jgi:two-component system nitrate/nitrite response regulator NarL
MEQFHNLAIGHIGALTAREQQVATLAESGLSNKGIANSLGLSEGTVKHHLHRVFQKLGIASRSALQQPNRKVALQQPLRNPAR